MNRIPPDAERGLLEDGAIGITLYDMQYGGTPLFTLCAAEHNQKIIDARS